MELLALVTAAARERGTALDGLSPAERRRLGVELDGVLVHWAGDEALRARIEAALAAGGAGGRGDDDALGRLRALRTELEPPAVRPAGNAPPYSYGSRDVQPGYESRGRPGGEEPWGRDPWADED